MILGTSSTKVPLAFSNLLFKPMSRTGLADSTCLFVWGVLLMQILALSPTLYTTCPIAGLRTGYHYQILTSSGFRNGTLCFSTRSAGPSTGLASIHFVKYSMETTRYFICRTVKGKGPRISIPHVWNNHGLYIDLNSSGGALCQSTCCWHCLHHWAYLVQSSLMVGQ